MFDVGAAITGRIVETREVTGADSVEQSNIMNGAEDD